MDAQVYLTNGQVIELNLTPEDCDGLLAQVGRKGPVVIDNDGVVHTAILAEHISAVRVTR